MSKQDRNTALTIAAVLLISIVTLIALGSALWAIIRPGVQSGLEVLGLYVNVATASYNFNIPGQVDVEPTEQPNIPEEQPEDEPLTRHAAWIDGNFYIAQAQPRKIDYSQFYKKDLILIDVVSAGYQITESNEVDLVVEIPKLGFRSRIYTDITAGYALQNGLVMHPNSAKFDEGEVIFACYRQYLPPDHPGSCFYLPTLAEGDEVLVHSNGQLIEYHVRGVAYAKSSNQNLYTAAESSDYLRIVTVVPGDSGTRLVVLAERTSN